MKNKLMSFILCMIFLGGCSLKENYTFEIEELSKKAENSFILIHGLNSDRDIWTDSFINKLKEKYSANVYTFEYPTKIIDPLKKSEPYDIVANQLRYFINSNQLKNVILICHSQGGLIAQTYISNNFYNNNVEKLILLGTPLMGSKLADYAQILPFASEHTKNLSHENMDLVQLQKKISYYERYHPKTLTILGENDSATTLENGYISFSFAKNYKVPLKHSDLYKFDKYQYLYPLLDDFINNDFRNYNSNVEMTNELYILFSDLDKIKYLIKGYTRLLPLSEDELSKQGYLSMTYTGYVKKNELDIISSKDLLTHSFLIQSSYGSKKSTADMMVEKENLLKKYKSESNLPYIHKYQNDYKVSRERGQSLWCKYEDSRSDLYHRIDEPEGILRNNEFPFNIHQEKDYMTISELEYEYEIMGYQCVAEGRVFIKEEWGEESILKDIFWEKLIAQGFRLEPKIDIPKKRSYLRQYVDEVEIKHEKKKKFFVKKINNNLYKVVNLPSEKKYSFDLKKVMHDSLKYSQAHGFNFDLNETIIVDIFMKSGKNFVNVTLENQ